MPNVSRSFDPLLLQVCRHAIEIARRSSSARVTLRHLEAAIKEIVSSALLPTIKGLCAQELAVIVGVCIDLKNLHAEETLAEAAYVRCAARFLPALRRTICASASLLR